MIWSDCRWHTALTLATPTPALLIRLDCGEMLLSRACRCGWAWPVPGAFCRLSNTLRHEEGIPLESKGRAVGGLVDRHRSKTISEALRKHNARTKPHNVSAEIGRHLI